MAYSAFGHTHCTFANSSKISGWLAAVPCQHDAGGLSWRRPNLAESYMLMVGLVAAATLLRLAVDPYIIGTQYPTFFLAAILSAFLGGICVGLLSVVLSTLSAWYFIAPPYSFSLTPGEAASLLSFVAIASLLVFIIGSLQGAHAATQEANSHAAVLEERARVSEELRLWAGVFEHAAFGISVIDPAGNKIRFANQAYALAQLMSIDEIQGLSVLAMYPSTERERISDLLAKSDRDGYVDYEADRVCKDGSVFPARIHVTSVRGPNCDVLYRIGTVQDITQERQLGAELSQALRLEAIGQLTAGVAHDFNNLLQAMMSILELIDDDTGVPRETQEKVSSAIRIADQGATLTQQLLSFARKQVLAPRKINLGDCLTEFHRRLLSRALDPRIRIDLIIEPDLKPVLADETHLRSALLNIVINARDAMPSGGELRIEASGDSAVATSGSAEDDPDGFAVIRVSDTGSGIAPENLAKVCDPFFSTKGLNGTGLGLSMVHGFAKQSGGDLRIKSESGKGTCVEVWLPLAPMEVANSVSV
jgi:PAS domain S-box-containing protein